MAVSKYFTNNKESHNVPYDNSGSGIRENNVGSAIDTLDKRVEKLERVVLWENPDPTKSFEAQDVTLKDNLKNYEYYEVIYVISDTLLEKRLSTGRITSQYDTVLTYAANYTTDRDIIAHNRTNVITIGRCVYYDAIGLNVQPKTGNDGLIPIEIYGYKKGE